MKKLLCLLLVCVGSSMVMAQGDFSAFQIFKDDVIKDVYENDEYIPLMDMDEARENLVQLSRSYDDIVKTVSDLKQRQSGLERHYNNATLSAALTLQDMEKTQDNLSKRRSQVAVSLNSVKKLNVSIKLLGDDIAQAKKQITTYSKFLFKMGNDYYLSDDEISDIKVLTKSDSIAHTLGEEELSRLLYTGLTMSFDKMNDLTSSYETTLHELQQHIASYHEEISLYEDDLEDLEQQREHVQQMVAFLEEDKTYLDEQISRFAASREHLKLQKDRMEEITQETEKFLGNNKEVAALLNEDDAIGANNYFSWPVRVPSGFDTEIKQAMYPGAGGVVIKANQGDELYAPAPGIVYKVYRDQGLHWMILLHKHGYSTVILPLSKIYVTEGQVVARGHILGHAGGRPGTTGAAIESRGSHVYMEVLKNSATLDPLLYMDISVFQDKDILDETYHLKRKQDYLSRKVDLSNLPVLRGDTAGERRDYFLSKSGNPIFADPGLWLSASEGAGIDPIFGICIGAAETSYRNFKSGNNIGNVGNDDSGNTVVYDSPKAGVAAIYKTLGNRYLGHYTMMSELSRFGNDNGSIYASDPVNRQKNILRCLSMIYEVNMPEEYFFRIKE